MENPPTTKITDAASCKAVVDTAIEYLKTVSLGESMGDSDPFTIMDWCFHAEVQAEVPATDTAAKIEADVYCEYFAFAAYANPEGPDAKGKDVRVVTPPKDGAVFSAWAFSGGKALPDLVAAADADSAKMITSALAAVATIAMVAY